MDREQTFDRRWILPSVFIMWHLLALLVSAIGQQTPSTLLARALPYVRPYLSLLYMGHVYTFYAPDPGVPVVLNSKYHLKNGGELEVWHHQRGEGVSSSEYLRTQNLGKIAGFPFPLSAKMAESYARHLCLKHPEAADVQLTNVTHRPLTKAEALEGKDPEGLSTYVYPVILGRWACL